MKDTINFLVFWVGTRCTLRCKNCGNLIPYVEQVSYECSKILDNLEYICNYVKISKLQIQGGEPFTHKEIAKIINGCANMSNIRQIEISTNGTILADEETIQVLAKHANKVTVRFSVYDCVDDEARQNKINILMSKGVNVENYNFMFSTGEWFDSGDFWQERNEDRAQVRTVYKNCYNRSCWTLADDYMACCGKILTLRNLKKNDEEGGDNVLNVTSLRLNAKNFLYELSEFDNRYINAVPEICAYCKLQNERIPAAIQLSKKEMEQIQQGNKDL